MSTIASPRDPSLSGRRIPLLSFTTPTSSSRPSLDTSRSSDAPLSPTHPPPNAPTPADPPHAPSVVPRRNRAALREYYNLQAAAPTTSPPHPHPSSPGTSSLHSLHYDDEAAGGGGVDSPGFDAAAYVKATLEEKPLGEVLAIYQGVLGDVRALDAERKALVYDNYSKLIVATEMIGRMREGVGAGTGRREREGHGSTTGEGQGVESVEELVESIRRGVEGLRKEGESAEREARARRARARAVVGRVLGAPGRVRALVQEGKMEEARRAWEPELRLLERWKERGVGGGDVDVCIAEGEAALKGEAAAGP
ncbi:hypothetical protein PZA11_007635 [Diplocarpon coronariae]|uniref:Vacuolar protein sorting-associated protein 51 homolog n=1 Tax=Diplocarpon coronariae TaxID=2795749 RepID=A0A218ZCB4_9HELO|nr:hypothetical protein JHW43_009430 [Diplocarpon mali]OWP05163.1 hypothetical protein B2J93_3294 [Marssonina coronariae]